MVGQILVQIAYQCPRCGTDLETGPGSVETWLRCPRCGRASLPPTYRQTLPPEAPVVIEPEPETFYIGPVYEPIRVETPLEPTITAPPVVSGLSGQRVALMVMLMVAMGAIADGVISRSPASGLLGFMMLGAGLIWMIAGGVRL